MGKNTQVLPANSFSPKFLPVSVDEPFSDCDVAWGPVSQILLECFIIFTALSQILDARKCPPNPRAKHNQGIIFKKKQNITSNRIATLIVSA